jgi:hypothetical protein
MALELGGVRIGEPAGWHDYLGVYQLESREVNGKPCWRHTERSDLWLAFDGVGCAASRCGHPRQHSRPDRRAAPPPRPHRCLPGTPQVGYSARGPAGRPVRLAAAARPGASAHEQVHVAGRARRRLPLADAARPAVPHGIRGAARRPILRLARSRPVRASSVCDASGRAAARLGRERGQRPTPVHRPAQARVRDASKGHGHVLSSLHKPVAHLRGSPPPRLPDSSNHAHPSEQQLAGREAAVLHC